MPHSPHIYLIAAMAKHNAIGHQNRLPWRLPADLQYFKQTTLGHTIVMGRLTWESIGCRPLPGRPHIILSRDPNYTAQGADVAHDFDQARQIVADRGEADLFVCGGMAIYKQTLPLADRLYITEIETEVEADAFFPTIDPTQWRLTETESHTATEANPHAYRFNQYAPIR